MAQGAQLENVIYVKTDTDEFLMHGRPCEVSANAFVPPSRPVDKNRNYFNTDREVRTEYKCKSVMTSPYCPRKNISTALYQQFCTNSEVKQKLVVYKYCILLPIHVYVVLCIQERYTTCEFDRIFNQPEGYNQYVHRCDREHAKSRGLKVNAEVYFYYIFRNVISRLEYARL